MRSLKKFTSEGKSNTGLENARRKRLGQHFLVSRAILDKIIASAALSKKDTVLEVGPGAGMLTRALAASAGSVVAVEKDADLCNSLGRSLARENTTNVRLVCGDILKIPLAELHLPARFIVVANIPYYLTSRLIRNFLEGELKPERMILMVQREVAERIIAKPPRMNLLALSVQAYGTPEVVAVVPRGAFSPPPAVESAVVKIASISAGFFKRHDVNHDRFFELIKAAFSQKRKTLQNSLAKFFASKRDATLALDAAGLAVKARPETLTLEDWVKLIRAATPR